MLVALLFAALSSAPTEYRTPALPPVQICPDPVAPAPVTPEK